MTPFGSVKTVRNLPWGIRGHNTSACAIKYSHFYLLFTPYPIFPVSFVALNSHPS